VLNDSISNYNQTWILINKLLLYDQKSITSGLTDSMIINDQLRFFLDIQCIEIGREGLTARRYPQRFELPEKETSGMY
jgi:hypothetical protein